MKLYFHKDPLGNFGDDLNPWLFDKLLPGIFSGHCYHDPRLRSGSLDAEALFVGIGTLLNHAIPKDPLKAVFGTGAGYGPAAAIDHRWQVYCVRGPRTAELLGLPPDLAITDAAALCRLVDLPEPDSSVDYAFMPHCSTARQGYWDEVCEALQIRYIDPQGSVEEIFAALKATEVLVTEAMHGAILADTLRIPWVPVSTTAGILSEKWQDWCGSLEMTYSPSYLPSLWKRTGRNSLRARAIGAIKFRMAKRSLAKVLNKATPQLSDGRLLDARIDQLQTKLELFRADVARGRYVSNRADI